MPRISPRSDLALYSLLFFTFCVNVLLKAPTHNISLTNFTKDEFPFIADVVESMTGAQVVSFVDSSVTQVVVGGEGRTLKVLRALALGSRYSSRFLLMKGIPLVTKEWIFASQDKGSFVDTAKYLAKKWFPAAAKHTRI